MVLNDFMQTKKGDWSSRQFCTFIQLSIALSSLFHFCTFAILQLHTSQLELHTCVHFLNSSVVLNSAIVHKRTATLFAFTQLSIFSLSTLSTLQLNLHCSADATVEMQCNICTQHIMQCTIYAESGFGPCMWHCTTIPPAKIPKHCTANAFALHCFPVYSTRALLSSAPVISLNLHSTGE